MADAPQWVSIVEGVGGALGAVSAAGVAALALVLQRRSNREERDRQARQQREDREAMRATARSDRIWEQRSDVYLELLEALQPDRVGDARAKLEKMYDAAWPLRSRVHAFGARDVVEAYSDFVDAVRMALSVEPVDTDLVDVSRRELRMAIRVSNGVDYADHLEGPGGLPTDNPFPMGNPISPPVPPPMSQQPWGVPDLPGYPPLPPRTPGDPA